MFGSNILGKCGKMFSSFSLLVGFSLEKQIEIGRNVFLMRNKKKEVLGSESKRF